MPEDPEASIKWLREHGVEVETPEDRAAARAAATAAASLEEGAPGTRVVSYCWIPADPNEPVEERRAVVPIDGAGDQLTTVLAPCFVGGSIDSASLRETAKQHFAVRAVLAAGEGASSHAGATAG